MNKNSLDEMQIQKRNKIGNQTFIMLLYLLMLDAGLYGFGFRWVSYPANIMIILTFCCATYVIRLIAGNAYLGPNLKNDRPVAKVIFYVLGSAILAAAIVALLKNFTKDTNVDDSYAPVLFIASAVSLIIIAITGVIRKLQNKKDE